MSEFTHDIPLSVIKLRTDKENALTTDQIWINKNPEYQREYEAWDDKLKSRFIETILLGRAMNPIWTIDNPDEKSEEILDGMHRLTTALDFLSNKFSVTGKYFTEDSKREEYDKKSFSDLSGDDQSKIRNYKFRFNVLSSELRTDATKRRDMYEILNRSSKTLNDYEFNKVLYNPYFDIISSYKEEINFFFKKTDQRGVVETEIIHILILSEEIPKSWNSINSLLGKFYKDNLGDTEESVENYLKSNTVNIHKKLQFIKKIILYLEQRNFFSDQKKIFNKNYLPYKFIISRLAYRLKDISTFNRNIEKLSSIIKSEITEVEEINKKLNCKTRNATFQKKLITFIDEIIDKNYKNEPRLFTKEMIQKKLKDQGNVCNHCKKQKMIYEGDHIIPWSQRGNTDYENLQVLCKDCHRKKGI